MMNAAARLPWELAGSKVQEWHRDRLAVVYVRQSTMAQVIEHGESTRLQYGLSGRAADLGWEPSRVLVIDEDLGHSASGAEVRPGFQRLVSEVGLDHVGIVLGIEMSRLARSGREWHQLLELCALSGTLLGDMEAVYDPNAHNDRLLLGLKGTISEALCRRRHKLSYADLVVMPMSDVPSAIRAGQRNPRFREVGIIRVIHSGTFCFRRRSAGDCPCLGRAASNP